MQRAAAALQVQNLLQQLLDCIRRVCCVLCLADCSAGVHMTSGSCCAVAPVQEDAYAPWTPSSKLLGGDVGAGPMLQSRGSGSVMRSLPAKLPASPAAERRLLPQAPAVPLSYH